MRDLTIPSGVTNIGDSAFANCTSLTAIAVDPLNSAYSSVDGVLFNKNQTTLIQCPGGKAGAYPNGVTSIGFLAFVDCTSLSSVTIPDSVKNVGDGAFANCTSMTSLAIPEGVNNVGRSGFAGCTSLTNITIGNSVATIGDYTFQDCTGLASIVVEPQNPNYTSLNGVLFNQSQTVLIAYPGGKLGSYSIPTGVTSIDDGAFAGTGLTSVTIPNSVISIGTNAFEDCWRLTSVTIPSSVTSIGVFPFLGCWNLAAITVDSANQNYSSIGGVWFDKAQTTLIQYPSAKAGASYAIPDTVTSIGNGAFSGCSSLTSVTIPKSVTSIGSSAFSVCSSLTKVFFDGNAPAVHRDVFEGSNDPGFCFGPPTVYFLLGTTGWSTDFAGLPTAIWTPEVQTADSSFGVKSNQFGFNVNWASGMTVVVEASPSLSNPVWSPVATNTLSGGAFYFGDPDWTNYPIRFYRVRSQ